MSIVITSLGLASSSNINKGFPNLASDKSHEVAVTSICKAELEAAGITPHVFNFLLDDKAEVPTKCVGQFGLWSFKRAWYYWRAEGAGIPVEQAEALHATHGKVVRVAGHCGCPSPREWNKGFGTSMYHVDTPEGLKALVDTLRSIYDPEQDPNATPRTGKL